MATVVDLTDDELATLRELTHQDDPAEAIRVAAREYVRYVLRMQLIELSGRIEMQDNWRELESAELGAEHDHGGEGTRTD